MIARLQKTFFLIILCPLIICIFFTSGSPLLDRLASHYSSYYSSGTVKFSGLRFSWPLSIKFNSVTISDPADKWHFEISSGNVYASNLGDIISYPRALHFDLQSILIRSDAIPNGEKEPKIQDVHGYAILKRSDVKIKVTKAHFEGVRLNGGVFFSSGELNKANLMISGAKKMDEYLGVISQYLGDMSSESKKPLRIKVIYAGNQIFLRGPKKSIASFSWSPN